LLRKHGLHNDYDKFLELSKKLNKSPYGNDDGDEFTLLDVLRLCGLGYCMWLLQCLPIAVHSDIHSMLKKFAIFWVEKSLIYFDGIVKIDITPHEIIQINNTGEFYNKCIDKFIALHKEARPSSFLSDDFKARWAAAHAAEAMEALVVCAGNGKNISHSSGGAYNAARSAAEAISTASARSFEQEIYIRNEVHTRQRQQFVQLLSLLRI